MPEAFQPDGMRACEGIYPANKIQDPKEQIRRGIDGRDEKKKLRPGQGEEIMVQVRKRVAALTRAVDVQFSLPVDQCPEMEGLWMDCHRSKAEHVVQAEGFFTFDKPVIAEQAASGIAYDNIRVLTGKLALFFTKQFMIAPKQGTAADDVDGLF